MSNNTRENRENKENKDDGDDGAIGTIGTMRRGYHSPIIPIFPIFPILTIFPINSTSISEINFLSEGRRVLHSAKMPPMGSTWRTSHWWHFLLGDAIDPLSQEIITC